MLLLVLLGLSLIFAIPQVAQAATITVNTTADELNSDGDCSLREAIRAANTNTRVDACTAGSSTENDTISVPSGTYTLTRTGENEDNATTGDLDIRGNLSLIGAGASSTILEGATNSGRDRVLEIHSGTVKISRVTIQNGGYDSGAGILNRSKLTVTSTTIRNNNTWWEGGGILNTNTGTLSLQSSTVRDNVTDEEGGGIVNSGTMDIRSSTIRNNEAIYGQGGGIHNGGTLTITSSTIKDNKNWGNGGGIRNSGTLKLRLSTVSGNQSFDEDGGGNGAGIYNGGSLHLSSTTISGNRAEVDGAGIWNSGTVTIHNGTIANNVADSNSNGTGDGGGIHISAGTVTSQNTIFANNSDTGGQAPDCAGTLNSASYNLIRSTTGCTISGDTTGNRLNVDPKLGPLQNNGGRTHTHALQTGSPAIDTGNPGTPGSGGKTCTSSDQRGVSRPKDGNDDGVYRCDIGAVERKSASTP
jgi:CSLREA domain-containing protein